MKPGWVARNADILTVAVLAAMVILVLWCICGATIVWGQDVAPVGTVTVSRSNPLVAIPLDPQEPQKLKCRVEPSVPLTSRVAIVLDVSGSMQGDALAKAHGFIRTILKKPVDGYHVSIRAFASTWCQWVPPEGMQPDKMPRRWAKFPSEEGCRAADSWIGSLRADGCTDPSGALKSALEEPVDMLSILLVTDGGFDCHGQVLATVKEVQARREQSPHGPAMIAALAVGLIDHQGIETLSTLARESGGGLWMEE